MIATTTTFDSTSIEKSSDQPQRMTFRDKFKAKGLPKLNLSNHNPPMATFKEPAFEISKFAEIIPKQRISSENLQQAKIYLILVARLSAVCVWLEMVCSDSQLFKNVYFDNQSLFLVALAFLIATYVGIKDKSNKLMKGNSGNFFLFFLTFCFCYLVGSLCFYFNRYSIIAFYLSCLSSTLGLTLHSMILYLGGIDKPSLTSKAFTLLLSGAVAYSAVYQLVDKLNNKSLLFWSPVLGIVFALALSWTMDSLKQKDLQSARTVATFATTFITAALLKAVCGDSFSCCSKGVASTAAIALESAPKKRFENFPVPTKETASCEIKINSASEVSTQSVFQYCSEPSTASEDTQTPKTLKLSKKEEEL